MADCMASLAKRGFLFGGETRIRCMLRMLDCKDYQLQRGMCGEPGGRVSGVAVQGDPQVTKLTWEEGTMAVMFDCYVDVNVPACKLYSCQRRCSSASWPHAHSRPTAATFCWTLATTIQRPIQAQAPSKIRDSPNRTPIYFLQ